MKKEKYGFVYIWRDRKHNRYYIGAHWGTEDDGYICSSNWMRNSYRRRQQDFKRRILFRSLSKEETFDFEYRWLQLIKNEELGKKYYNYSIFHNIKSGKRIISKETSQKISDNMKLLYKEGKINRYHSYLYSKESISKRAEKRKGVPLSEEHKEKIKKSKKFISDKTREKLREKALGRKQTKETKEKLRQIRFKQLQDKNGVFL